MHRRNSALCLFAVLVLAPLAGSCSQSKPVLKNPLRAAVLEYGDRYTSRTIGAARLLEDAGFSVAALDPAQPIAGLDADVIVFGSFVSESRGYRQLIKAYGGEIAGFVKNGGVVVQFTQTDQVEGRVPFLPEGLYARRCDADVGPVYVRAADHPLLQGWLPPGVLPGRLDLPRWLNRPPNWESLEEFRGFRVLLGADEENRFPVMLEGAHGKGRFILTSTFLDKIDHPGGYPIAPKVYQDAALGFFKALYGYVDLVRQGNAPVVVPSPPYKPPDPLPFVPGSFTLAVLPDTQIYCWYFPEHFYRQTEWIARNAKKHNIRYVLHLGDVTHHNIPEEWAVARKAMKRLDGVVPYAIAPGNHDYGTSGTASSRETLLDAYFPIEEQGRLPGFGGVMEEGRLENSYHTFEVNGAKFLIVALEFGPRDVTVEWANRVVAAHPDHRAILITHAYLYFDNSIYDWSTFGPNQHWNPHDYPVAASPAGVNDGLELWRKLVGRHANFIMAINGHVLGDGLGYQRAEGRYGNVVHQMLVNYQMKFEGGEGFLRLIEFLPDGETVQVKAYSPSLDRYRTDEQNQFVVQLSPKIQFEK